MHLIEIFACACDLTVHLKNKILYELLKEQRLSRVISELIKE